MNDKNNNRDCADGIYHRRCYIFTDQKKEKVRKQMNFQKEIVDDIKKRYPAGTQICVDYMYDDPNPIMPGTKGTVNMVDDIGTIHCTFENGRCLGLVPGVDSFHKVEVKTVDKGR